MPYTKTSVSPCHRELRGVRIDGADKDTSLDSLRGSSPSSCNHQLTETFFRDVKSDFVCKLDLRAK